MNKLDSKPLSFPVNPQVSENTIMLIKGCLQINEEKRWNWEDLFNSIQRIKQRTESLCQQINKNNRSFSNTPIQDKQKQATSYLDFKKKLKQNLETKERERRCSQKSKFHTKRSKLNN